MTTIGLIRHGFTEWNCLGKAQGISDIPLNELGREQALSVGQRLLQDENWDLIVSSDLTRAVETASIIGSLLNIPITYDKRIREIECGQIEGTTEEERIMKWGSNWRKLNLGMENFEDVSNRGFGFVEELTNTYNGKRALIVSHGALIGLTLQKLLPQVFQKTYIDNTSVTILDNCKGEWNCSLYNCTKHIS
jgi:2,3-bisphosphoglycerate-dependent phosphoglycerate mutase